MILEFVEENQNMPSVKLVNINKIYPNNVQAVFDFNLEIHDKEFIAFVGPSGCGKTTTLRMIAGLEEITSGMLFIDDRLVNDVAPKDRDIAMVFQSYALYPHMNVFNNMAFGLKMRKVPVPMLDKEGKEIYEIDKKMIAKYEKQLRLFLAQLKIAEENNPESIEEIQRNIAATEEKIEYYRTTPVQKYRYVKRSKKEIEDSVFRAASVLQLEKYLDRKPDALSGGQRQRVALGRAIVRKVKVFLMDEPLSNLDAKLRVQMRTEIIKLHQRMEAITIYVTHDQTEAMTMADRIVVMKDGYVQQIGAPKEIYDHPVNKFVAGFIGAPAMNFIEGTFEEDHLSFFGYDVVLSPERTKILQEALKDKEDKKVIIGVRPEHIIVTPNEEGKIALQIVETLGSELLLHFNISENTSLCAKVITNDVIKAGQKVNFTFNTDFLHVFDSETEVAYF